MLIQDSYILASIEEFFLYCNASIISNNAYQSKVKCDFSETENGGKNRHRNANFGNES